MNWKFWIRDLFDRNRLDVELDEELRDHVARQTEYNMSQGLPEEEARRKALREFGQDQAVRESVRYQRHGERFDSVRQDVGFAFRMLRKNWTFTAIAIATLAVGIGANTAIFSLVYATLVRPLPYGNQRLVAFAGNQSLPDVKDIARSSATLTNLGVFADFPFEMQDGDVPVEAKGAIVGGDVFRALAVEPQMGRYFGDVENEARIPVAVVSAEFWRSQLHSDANVLGRKIALSGNVYEVIGVMPDGFHLPRGESKVWVPFTVAYPEAVNARGAHFTFGLGTLKERATIEQTRVELKRIGDELALAHPEEARAFNVIPIREAMVRKVRRPLLVLFGAVFMVLLIACINYSSLLLSRMAAREREFNVRLALGAGRRRVVQQLVTESLVIATLGSLGGLALAGGAIRLLLAFKPKDLTGVQSDVFSASTFSFAIGLALLCGLFFSIAPAVRLLRSKTSLRETERNTTVRQKRRSVLVVAECAMAVMLLSGAGLLIRSFWKLVDVDPGFNPRGLLTMRVNLSPSRYREISQQEEFFTRLDRELQSVSEIESAGVVSELPLTGTHMEHNVIIKGRPEIPVGEEPEISAHEASAQYFKTMQIPLLSGRAFNDRDDAHAPLVAIITESMARQYFRDEEPIGAQVAWARATQKTWMTIVGVVGDVRHDGLDDKPYPAVYTPITQKQMAWKRSGAIVVRTRASDPMLSAEIVKMAVLRVDPRLPVTLVESMTTVMAESLAERRFNLLLLSAFATMALLLAMIGIYGVISYLVTQRTQEIGIRMALGAQRNKVVRMILAEGVSMTLIGVVIGTVAGFGVLRLSEGMLYGVTSNDPVAIGGAGCVLLIVAALACVFPARRAARIDPISALRVD